MRGPEEEDGTTTDDCGVCVSDWGRRRRKTGRRPTNVVYVWMAGEGGEGRLGDDQRFCMCGCAGRVTEEDWGTTEECCVYGVIGKGGEGRRDDDRRVWCICGWVGRVAVGDKMINELCLLGFFDRGRAVCWMGIG